MSNFGSVFASGIQDISAIAAVLGTDMCDMNAGLSMSNGFLFPAACGMSMFGILGLSKYLIKSSLPDRILRNIGVDVSNFDKFKLIEYSQSSCKDLFSTRQGIMNGVEVYFDVPCHPYWTILSLLSCLVLSALNLIPYIPHFVHNGVSSLTFPLIMCIGSCIASYVACIDPILLLSGQPDMYKRSMILEEISPHFVSTHFGNTYIMILSSLIGIVSSVAIIIGYIGSYMVVQDMSDNDTYWWLALELVLCALRIVVWSLDSTFDDNHTVYIMTRSSATREAIIRNIDESLSVNVAETRQLAEMVVSKISDPTMFIEFHVFHTYLVTTVRTTKTEYSIPRYSDPDPEPKPVCFIQWDERLHSVRNVLCFFDNIGIVMSAEEVENFVMGLPLNGRTVTTTKLTHATICLNESDLQEVEETMSTRTYNFLGHIISQVSSWLRDYIHPMPIGVAYNNYNPQKKRIVIHGKVQLSKHKASKYKPPRPRNPTFIDQTCD